MRLISRLARLTPPGRRWLAGAVVLALAGGGVAFAGSRARAPHASVAASGAAAPAATGTATAGGGKASPGTSATSGAATASAGAPGSAATQGTAAAGKHGNGSATGGSGTGSAPVTVDVTGTVQPVQAVGLSFGVAGTVTQVDVHPGQRVAAGTVLATLDTAGLRSQLKQAQASVAQAQANLALIQAKVSSDQLAVQQAQGNLQQQQAALAAARAAKTLTAPVAGIVERVAATVGDSLAPGQEVLSVVPPASPVQIATQVAQQSAHDVQVGDPAVVNIPAVGATLSGQVSAIGAGSAGGGSGSGAAGSSSGDGTIDVTVLLSSAPATVRDGMTALVNIRNAGVQVQATGSVQYANEWEVTAPKGGTLADLLVGVGDRVDAGQTLARLSGSGLDSAVQGAQQAVTQAEASLAQARAGAESDASGQQAADKAALAGARASEAAAAANLASATLTAPFAATVGEVNVASGQSVSPGGASGGSGSTGSGAAALSGDITLIGRAGFEVVTMVPDTEIGQVGLGAKAWVTPVDGLPPVQAVVSQITPQASSGSGEPAFPVTLTVVGHPAGLLTGETAHVAILVGGGA